MFVFNHLLQVGTHTHRVLGVESDTQSVICPTHMGYTSLAANV